MWLIRSRAILAAATAGAKCGGSKYARGATFLHLGAQRVEHQIAGRAENTANVSNLKTIALHLQVTNHGDGGEPSSVPPSATICSATSILLAFAASTTSLPKPAKRSLVIVGA